MNARRRLERLEQHLERSPASEQIGTLAIEVRAIDETITRLEAEIAENEASMTPEEARVVRAEHEADMALLGGLTFEEKIAALEIEIAEVNTREEETDEERSKR